MRKKISVLLIIIGLVMFFYPNMYESYYNYKKKKIMDNMNFPQEEYMNISKIKKENEVRNEEKEAGYAIKIDKINLFQPILEGASTENLKTSISTINKNINPGDVGNYALAGHRSHTYGRNFNRLDEISIGDEVKIYKNSTMYTYIVTKKFTVNPDEIWVLNNNEKEKELTLVTCDPLINPYRRLIIKGILN